MLKIARGLEADGILNGAGNAHWHTSNISQILRNEKYIGDALLQKTYTTDFLTKTRVKNQGIVPQYYVENSHEAIIPHEIFMQVQEELVRRRLVHGKPRCISRLENTGLYCDARTVPESRLEQVLVKAINRTLCDKDDFLNVLQKNIETVLSHGNDRALADIEKRLKELQAELLKLAVSNSDYEKVGNEIYRLRDEKQKALMESANRDEAKKRIADMSAFLREQPAALTQYDEPLVQEAD
jgi:site-specific DNA recombinase